VTTIEDIAADAIARAVAAIGAQVPPACYSSTSLPPGFRTRKAFNAACVAGRVKGAHKGGRLWLVRVDDYHRIDEPIARPTPISVARPSGDAEARARASLAAQGDRIDVAPRRKAG